jgi:5-methylcytosine-specific restriction protein A
MPTDSTSLTDADRSVIERFRPQRKDLVRDTAASAGIPTGHWKANDDPAFRSEWCFGAVPGPAVLFIDHVELRAFNGSSWPCYRSNLREEAIQLKREADELGLSGAAVSGQIERAGKFDMLLMHSARRNSPLQVALLAGSIKKRGRDKRDRYSVDLRQLDTHLWRVMHYDVTTGNHLLVRTDVVATPESNRKPFDADSTLTREPSAAPVAPGAQTGATRAPAPVADVPPAPATPAEPLLVDQFSLPAPPQREEVTLSRACRDPAVRQAVLRRAGGCCELCSTPGFRTRTGALYLETHHVVPLEDEGADAEWNMAAICPGEHREAHYGERAQTIGQRLLAFLIARYPAQEPVIRAQARRARELRAQRQPCVLA